MTKTWYVGVRQDSNTVNENIYEKRNPKTIKTKELVKFIKGACSVCGRNKTQIFTK